MNKEEYNKNREVGKRGQGNEVQTLVSYTPSDKVKQGKYGTRKERRLKEAHHQPRAK